MAEVSLYYDKQLGEWIQKEGNKTYRKKNDKWVLVKTKIISENVKTSISLACEKPTKVTDAIKEICKMTCEEFVKRVHPFARYEESNGIYIVILCYSIDTEEIVKVASDTEAGAWEEAAKYILRMNYKKAEENAKV